MGAVSRRIAAAGIESRAGQRTNVYARDVYDDEEHRVLYSAEARGGIPVVRAV